MSATLLAPPVVEPITLAEAKNFLRVEHDDDDDLITALVSGARSHVENATRAALITQRWRLSLDGWPEEGRIEIRPAPLQALAAARVYDENGAARDLDTQAFVVDNAASVLAFAPSALPRPGRIAAGIALDVVCGYGETGAAIPEPLRQAVRLLVAHWYENRGLVAIGHETALLPQTVAALLAPFRLVSL
ncbi:MAG: phage head-tail connector protein [Pseudolabrys sp.]|nr:phage head-tail connector protein [Pseudolabrys sp.]